MERTTLKKCRLHVGKTQAEVAGDLNISEIYVRKLEAGHSHPGRKLMIKFERYYGKSAQDLFPDLFEGL